MYALFYLTGLAMGWYLRSKRGPQFKDGDKVRVGDKKGYITCVRWSPFGGYWEYTVQFPNQTCYCKNGVLKRAK